MWDTGRATDRVTLIRVTDEQKGPRQCIVLVVCLCMICMAGASGLNKGDYPDCMVDS